MSGPNVTPVRLTPGPPATVIADEWKTYRERVMDPDAPYVQVSETQMAFYAGAAAVLGKLINGITSEAEPTDADLDVMTDLYNETIEYAKRIKEGTTP